MIRMKKLSGDGTLFEHFSKINLLPKLLLPNIRNIGPQAKQYIGEPIYTTTHRNKTVNVYRIKHIYIVLGLPTKQCFNIKKNIPTQHT